MLKLKSVNVNIKELKFELKCKIFDLALICRKVEGEKYTMTITSGNDGKHMRGSKHYTNEAIDIRINDMQNPKRVSDEIAFYLGKNYDVVLEPTHIHIEYDPKGIEWALNKLNSRK